MLIRNKAKTVLCNITPQIRPPISAISQIYFFFTLTNIFAPQIQNEP